MPLTYAIGDLHGRLDLLLGARDAIAKHADGRPHQVVGLGDYVDRGPNAKGVVETLLALAAGQGWICIKGNHEAMMVEALRTRRLEAIDLWTSNGGDKTLASYGDVDLIPADHVDWLEGLPLSHYRGQRLYVHAGVAPRTPLAQQDARALLWIRDPFLTASADALPCHVVHGHTPRWRGKPEMARPERLPQRTNLDTGAVLTGVLSVGVFDDGAGGGPLEILSITPSE